MPDQCPDCGGSGRDEGDELGWAGTGLRAHPAWDGITGGRPDPVVGFDGGKPDDPAALTVDWYERYRECLELMVAAQKERNDLDRRWRRACELGDALARAAGDLLVCPPDSHLSPSGGTERRALAAAVRAYEEG